MERQTDSLRMNHIVAAITNFFSNYINKDLPLLPFALLVLFELFDCEYMCLFCVNSARSLNHLPLVLFFIIIAFKTSIVIAIVISISIAINTIAKFIAVIWELESFEISLSFLEKSSERYLCVIWNLNVPLLRVLSPNSSSSRIILPLRLEMFLP